MLLNVQIDQKHLSKNIKAIWAYFLILKPIHGTIISVVLHLAVLVMSHSFQYALKYLPPKLENLLFSF